MGDFCVKCPALNQACDGKVVTDMCIRTLQALAITQQKKIQELESTTHFTDRDRAIISAYTGYLICDFDDVLKLHEEIMGRPVFVHELVLPEMEQKVKEALKSEWLRIIGLDPREKKSDKDKGG